MWKEGAIIYLRLVEGAASVLDGMNFRLIRLTGGVMCKNVRLARQRGD